MYSLRHLLTAVVALLPLASASERVLESSSLQTCMENSGFTAKQFSVAFTPVNNTLAFNVNGISAIVGNVTAELVVYAYGLNAYSRKINPCDEKDFAGMCPMNNGPLDINTQWTLGDKDVKQVPGIAYTFPDIDVKVQILVNRTNSDVTLACIEAELTNGKSVYQKAVGWITAIIAGIGLMASAITSGLGHSNTAAHVAANALSLFGYFQSQAFIAMMAVPLPPIVASWTQNFVWTMGIIRVGFLQDMATWYQRATGGTPSTVVSNSENESVTVQKRSIQMISRAFRALAERAASTDTSHSTVTIRGIERVGFRANIELTNIFFTGYTFFIIFFLFVVIGVVLFKYIVEALVKANKLKSDQFLDFRNGWKTVLKGILFRIVLISFPQVVVLCLWELTVRDSAAEVVLAVVTIIMEVGILAWASLKVWRMAQRSVAMHKNPAYILYSDPVALNKWGFLYVQFRAAAYYFVIPVLGYILIKGMFIAFAQKNGTVQAVALVIIEAAFLVGVCVMRPYMDKKTNGFNISIAAINFLCAIFLLVFSDVFNQPGIVTGVMGVIFFLFNAVFALVLLLMVLIASIYALASKNPDTRYQPMRDDRGSFIKSQTTLNVGAELDALGATARGDGKNSSRGWEGSQGFGNAKARTAIDDDDSSFESQRPGAGGNGIGHITPGQNGYYSSNRDSTYSSYTNGASPMQSHTFMPAAGYNSPTTPGGGARGGGGGRAQGGNMWQRGAGFD